MYVFYWYVCVCFKQTGVYCILCVCVCFVQRDVYLEEEWIVNGCNYSKTLEAWLALMDRQMDKVKKIFTQTYGQEADKQIFNWRLFFIFCSEVFGYNGGNEWHIAQYRFKKQLNSSLWFFFWYFLIWLEYEHIINVSSLWLHVFFMNNCDNIPPWHF